MEIQLSDIDHAIQLAAAPAFLLTAVATVINTMNTRLGRILDRRRALQDRIDAAGGIGNSDCSAEMEHLRRRGRLIYFALLGLVLAALLVCMVVAGLFLVALTGVEISSEIAGLFIASMLATIGALSLFLREVYVAVIIVGNYKRR